MGKPVLSKVLLVLGALDIVFALFTPRTSLLTYIFAIALLAAGWMLRGPSQAQLNSSAPQVAPGFNATHWHRNIAIDAGTQNLWIRDENGSTRILTPSQVLGWTLEADQQSKSIAGGGLVFHNVQTVRGACKLLIKTADLDHPVWKVRFDAHTDLLAAGGNANYREMQEWSDRLTAFYHQRVA